MKKWRNGLTLASIKLLLSYFSIIALPLVVIIYLYFMSTNYMLSLSEEGALNDLSGTSLNIDKHIQEVQNLTVYLSATKEFSNLSSKVKSDEATFFDFYEFAVSFPDYSLFNDSVEQIYCFFDEQDYYVLLPSVIPSTQRGIEVGGELTVDYESFSDALEKTYKQPTLTLIETHTGENMLCMMLSVPYPKSGDSTGTIVAVYDKETLRDVMTANIVSNSGIVAVVDSEENVMLTKFGENSEENDLNEIISQNCDFTSDSCSIVKNINGTKYSINRVESHDTGLVYYSAVPQDVLLQPVAYIQLSTLIMCVLSVVVSIYFCILIANRRRKLLVKYSKYATDHLSTEKESADLNFWDGLSSVIDSVSNLQEQLSKQESLVRSGTILMLIKGEQSNVDVAWLENQQLLTNKYYFIASFLFDIHCAQDIELIEKNLNFECYCCEPEENHVAVLIPSNTGDDDLILRGLSAAATALCSATTQDVFTGLSNPTTKLSEVEFAYDEARAVCNHLHIFNNATVMRFSEMPTSNDSFYFPLERELSMHEVISSGSLIRLYYLFSTIVQDNFAERNLSVNSQKCLVDIVKGVAIQALLKNEDNLSDEDSKWAFDTLRNAKDLEKIMLVLERTVTNVKSNIKDGVNSETKEKKRAMVEHIEANYNNSGYSLEELATHFSVTPTKMYNDFKRYYNISFSTYLENYRIKKACDYLKEGKGSIEELSEAVGYLSGSSFRRAFKRVMGVTPSAYKEFVSNENSK